MSGKIERYVRELAAKAQRLEVPHAIEDRFGRYRWDPVGFVREILGAASATRRNGSRPYQFDILADLAAHPRVTVRSGHGVGKSTVAAWATLWWLLTRPLSRVVIVAPEFSRQVKAVLFSEIRKWARRSKVPLPVQALASRVLVEGYGEEWSAIGLPATEPDRIEGFHSEAGLLLILDETKGIPQDVYDALQGALTGLEDNRLLVTSTPGGPAGPFHRIWTRESQAWRRHHIPSTDSSLVSQSWVEDRRREWGEGSPLWQARVLGDFPDAGEGVLFPLPLLEAAVDRAIAMPEDAAVTMGVDVARSIDGDLNAIAVARGGRLEAVVTFRSADTMHVVERAVREAAARGPKLIRVDVGGPGAGVCDRLRQLEHRVDEVHFGGGPLDAKRFKNRRAELYWNLRERLERGEFVLPDDDELIADLASIRYVFAADGRIQLETKDDVRKRLGRSPDRADALALAAAGDAAGHFFHEWRRDVHVVEPFEIPEHWPVEAGLAWGYDPRPGVLEVAAFDEHGRAWLYKELVFRRRSPWELAELKAKHLTSRKERDMIVHADPAMWVTDAETGVSIAEEVNDRLADLASEIILVKASGDRFNGWARVHQYLHADSRIPGGDTGPLLRVFAHATEKDLGCHYLIETLPAQVHDPDRPGDLVKTERGAAVDALRFLLAGRPPIATLPFAGAEPHHIRVHSNTQRLLAGVLAKKRHRREISELGDLFS